MITYFVAVGNMYVLSTSPGCPWRLCSVSPSIYTPTRSFVKRMLEMAQELTPRDVASWQASFTDQNNIVISIIKIERHRHCTVAYCIQQNPTTNGIRFVVYGIKHETDYGIGISLASITTESSLQFCPPHVTARYVEI